MYPDFAGRPCPERARLLLVTERHVIVYVEDHPENFALVQKALEATGRFTVMRAATAEEYASAITLPAETDLPENPPPEPRQPVAVDEALRDLLLPGESGQG